MNHLYIDFETLGNPPDGIVLELSCIAFSFDEHTKFENLVDTGIKIRFDIDSQKKRGRIASKGAIDFWKKQDPELIKQMFKSDEPKSTIEEGIKIFNDYCSKHKIDPWKSTAWCRGQSFDFPMLVSLLSATYGIVDTFDVEPVKFWNQRDTRTFIAGITGDINKKNIPILKSEVPGFIAHDSIHDCAKDIIMIKKGIRMVAGEPIEWPEDESEYVESTLR